MISEIKLSQLIFFILILSACSNNKEPIKSNIPTGIIEGTFINYEGTNFEYVVYAVENNTKDWYSVETSTMDEKIQFSIDVLPGEYNIYAYSYAGIWGGYSESGFELSDVEILSGQCLSKIVIQEPDRLDCGPYYGLPASPDGLFSEQMAASEECLSSLNTMTGSISGLVRVADESDMPLTIYAVDAESGDWVTQVFEETAKETNFAFDLPAGPYLLFAFSESGAWAGYSTEGYSLTPIALRGGQSISEINLQSIIIEGCGPYFGMPESPDGRYQEVIRASQDCLNEIAFEKQ